MAIEVEHFRKPENYYTLTARLFTASDGEGNSLVVNLLDRHHLPTGPRMRYFVDKVTGSLTGGSGGANGVTIQSGGHPVAIVKSNAAGMLEHIDVGGAVGGNSNALTVNRTHTNIVGSLNISVWAYELSGTETV